MSNNKQSSIMWLYEKMFVHRGNITIEEFEQAKAMHKQEIIKAYMNVNDDRDYRLQDVILKEFAEQYYNETFQ